MTDIVKTYFLKFLRLSAAFFVVVVLTALFAGSKFFWAGSVAYVLSFLFVGSNFIVIRNADLDDHKRFNRIFFISLGLRFVFIIASVSLVLGGTKIHQIFFTVSFIISYILHSVIEIIFLNKILETDTRDT